MNEQKDANFCLIMGIVNITPDSFSDGGDYLLPKAAIARCEKLIEQGADIIDLGAESTRPGAKPVSSYEQIKRLRPVVQHFRKEGLESYLSIDSRCDQTILSLLDHCHMRWINNVAGLFEDSTLTQLSSLPLNYICMHATDTPEQMQQKPLKGRAAVTTVFRYLYEARSKLKQAGFSDDRIFEDPGIGFGKDDGANLALLEACMNASNRNLCVGVSRKSFIGRLIGGDTPKQRDPASKMLEFALMASGIKIIRTHEVGRLALMRNQLYES